MTGLWVPDDAGVLDDAGVPEHAGVGKDARVGEDAGYCGLSRSMVAM